MNETILLKSRYNLMQALCFDGLPHVSVPHKNSPANVVGWLLSVEREDGSGKSFNLRIELGNDNGIRIVHWRAND